MKHPTIQVEYYTNLVVFSTGFIPTTHFLLCFFHPDFLEVWPLALAYLSTSDFGFWMVEMAPPIL